MSKEILTLRGHHLHHLKDYLHSNSVNYLTILIAEDIIFKYGEEFFSNRKKTLETMSKEDSLIKITKEHDNICKGCKFKVKKGCIMEGIFYKEEETAEKDNENIKDFNLELNKIYSGKEIATLLIN